MRCMVEISRNNVTVSQFLAMVKYECKKKGMDFMISKQDFENPSQTMNNRYVVKDGKKITYSDGFKQELELDNTVCKAEIYRIQPLNYQIYGLYNDNSVYNEICEFTFDNEKTGHGYYYQINK